MTRRFWALETREEFECVNGILERSFPRTVALFRDALQRGDPQDVVYDNNPAEYADVVREIVALLSWQAGDPRRLESEMLKATVAEALARCFDEPPDSGRLDHTMRLVQQSLSAWT
jgi:hypothetical protein